MIQVSGAKDVMAELMKYGNEVKEMVIDQIEDTATNIEIKAIRNKGANLSFIRLDKLITKGGLRAVVGVQGDNLLAVYFEFGTGVSARWILAPYPQEIKDLARRFYITGEGTLRGQPYFFPAWLEEKPIFTRAMEQILVTATENFNKRSWVSRTFRKW